MRIDLYKLFCNGLSRILVKTKIRDFYVLPRISGKKTQEN
jgi:hypothetical protein